MYREYILKNEQRKISTVNKKKRTETPVSWPYYERYQQEPTTAQRSRRQNTRNTKNFLAEELEEWTSKTISELFQTPAKRGHTVMMRKRRN